MRGKNLEMTRMTKPNSVNKKFLEGLERSREALNSNQKE